MMYLLSLILHILRLEFTINLPDRPSILNFMSPITAIFFSFSHLFLLSWMN